MFRKKGRFSLLENFQKIPLSRLPPEQTLIPPPSWIPTFMLSTNKNFILSCSHCYCIILTSYSLYTEVMLIFILMLNIYRMLFLVMKRIQIVKIPPPLVPTARKKKFPPAKFPAPFCQMKWVTVFGMGVGKWQGLCKRNLQSMLFCNWIPFYKLWSIYLIKK